MKFFYTFLFLTIVLTFSSCLTYRTVEFVADFGDNFNNGEFTAIYSDIRSSEQEPKKQREDFEELLKMTLEDQFLLDHVAMGLYIKERQVYEENGKIMGKFSGIFEKVALDDAILEVEGDERYILIDIDEGDIVETNGKVHKSKEKALIVWPKKQKIISYKITKTYDDPTYSITHLYRDWLQKQ